MKSPPLDDEAHTPPDQVMTATHLLSGAAIHSPQNCLTTPVKESGAGRDAGHHTASADMATYTPSGVQAYMQHYPHLQGATPRYSPGKTNPSSPANLNLYLQYAQTCSPQLSTPKSAAGSRTAPARTPNLISKHLASPSPSSRSHLPMTPGSAQKLPMTPTSCQRGINSVTTNSGQKVYNPFDKVSVHQLNGPVFSPGVFNTVTGSAEKTPKSFRWSIDQMAELTPADIEEMPLHQESLHNNLDHLTEQQAQKAIDSFFSQMVVPSPWSDKSRPVFQLPRTPGHISTPPPSQVKANCKSRDAASQTACMIPMDVDLQKLLPEYYASEDAGNLSNSSLRRKLFFHGDVGTPLSPVRSGQKEPLTFGDDVSFISPAPAHTPQATGRLSPFSTPSSAQFSSSPIRHTRKTGLRRCSTAPDLHNSPDFSPITDNAYPSSGASHLATPPLCTPLLGTPSTGRPTMPVFDSPGMSPIISITHDEPVTPCSGGTGRRKRQRPEKVPTPMELRPDSFPMADMSPSPCHWPSSCHRSPPGGRSPQHVHSAPSSPCPDRSDDIRREVRSPHTDLVSHMDVDHDDLTSLLQPNETKGQDSHDTGYHSSSLQLTSQEVTRNITSDDCRMQDSVGCEVDAGSIDNHGGYFSGLHREKVFSVASSTDTPTASNVQTTNSFHCNLTNPFSRLPLPGDDTDSQDMCDAAVFHSTLQDAAPVEEEETLGFWPSSSRKHTIQSPGIHTNRQQSPDIQTNSQLAPNGQNYLSHIGQTTDHHSSEVDHLNKPHFSEVELTNKPHLSEVELTNKPHLSEVGQTVSHLVKSSLDIQYDEDKPSLFADKSLGYLSLGESYHEDFIIRRARQLLGRKSPSPTDHHKTKPSFPMRDTAIGGGDQGHGIREPRGHSDRGQEGHPEGSHQTLLPSQFASEILRRAEQDLIRFTPSSDAAGVSHKQSPQSIPQSVLP